MAAPYVYRPQFLQTTDPRLELPNVPTSVKGNCQKNVKMSVGVL
jgi:hypothetical protein